MSTRRQLRYGFNEMWAVRPESLIFPRLLNCFDFQSWTKFRWIPRSGSTVLYSYRCAFHFQLWPWLNQSESRKEVMQYFSDEVMVVTRRKTGKHLSATGKWRDRPEYPLKKKPTEKLHYSAVSYTPSPQGYNKKQTDLCVFAENM